MFLPIVASRAVIADQSAASYIVPARYRIDGIEFGREIKCHHIHVTCTDCVLYILGISVIILLKCDVRFGRLVIVIHMPVAITVTLVITPTVVFHHVLHPFEISLEHLLYLGIVMRPVAGCIPVRTVIRSRSSRITPAVTRESIHVIGGIVYLIVARDETRTRLEHAVLAEILRRHVAPARHCLGMVDHNIRHHFRAAVMERSDQLLQIRTATPIAVLVRVLFRVIAHSACVAAGRQPDQVKIGTYLAGLS